MIATPLTEPLGSADRRAHRPRRPETRHADLVRGHACPGLLTHTGTHLAHVKGRGNLPMAVDARCSQCGDQLTIGRDGRVLWTESQEEREATDGRIDGGLARRKGVA